MQNLPRGGALRRALMAPAGKQVLTVDASQIEARLVAWICGQAEIVEAFRTGKDVYSLFASEIFNRPISKADKAERFIGKTGILGLGYGVGWMKFQNTVKLQSKAQTGQQIELTEVEAQNVVSVYRGQTCPRVKRAWRSLGSEGLMALTGAEPWTFGPCTFGKGEVLLPSGLKLYYHDLTQDEQGEWSFSYGGLRKRLYGGKLLENIVQALARIIVMDAALRIEKRFALFNGPQLAGQAHDELIYVEDEDMIDVCKAIVLEEMRRPPSWASDLPLDAEAGVGANYGEAK